jgi:hypothetical protein
MNLLESTEEQLLAVDQFFESQGSTASGYNTALRLAEAESEAARGGLKCTIKTSKSSEGRNAP